MDWVQLYFSIKVISGIVVGALVLALFLTILLSDWLD